MIATLPFHHLPASLKPWDVVMVKPGATLPCGAPHPFRGLLCTIVRTGLTDDASEDCTVMVHAPSTDLAARMSGDGLAWTGYQVLTTFPLRLFGMLERELIRGCFQLSPAMALFFNLDRINLLRSGKVTA